MRIDTEELLVALFEKGIDTEISVQQIDIVVELKNHKDDSVIGVAKAQTAEAALATIVRRLADDSTAYKVQNSKYDGLSLL